jgi:hypothetical protein
MTPIRTDIRRFSAIPPPRGGPGPKSEGDAGYTTEEEGASFESDRKFSNFILFSGAIALGILFMVSNVLHLKKEKEGKQQADK